MWCFKHSDQRRRPCHGDDDDEEPSDERVVELIDMVLHEHGRGPEATGKAFRQVAKPDSRGVAHISRDQVPRVLRKAAKALALPESLFAELQVDWDFFDFNGDGGLDEHETRRIFARLLRQRRRDLAGLKKVAMPHETLQQANYMIVKELGRGGQGVMYLCTKGMPTGQPTQQRFCLKVYEKANANAGGLDEILEEYRLMKHMSNNHVARTYEVFDDDRNFYLVNEPYFGGDLTKLTMNAQQAGVLMTEDWFRTVFGQCLLGLRYLHSCCVMHCDIKEPNIMVADTSYGSPRLVLIDFGLSAAFIGSRSGVCGTPGYIPPETWQSNLWYPSGDVFSLGVVFFQLLTNVQGVLLPPQGSPMGMAEFAQAALFKPLPWEHFPQGAPVLQDLVARMLVRERPQRPRPAQALAHPWFAEWAGAAESAEADEDQDSD